MTDLNALDFYYPDEPRPEIPTPRKCRRHQWISTHSGAFEAVYGNQRNAPEAKYCTRCGHTVSAAVARRGRNNRSRGNAIEREVGAKLALRRVGQFGGPDDLAGDLFRVQVKSGAAFSEKFWRWLRAVPASAEQTRLLVVTDAPGPGHKRRAVVVLDLEDWVALHGEGL